MLLLGKGMSICSIKHFEFCIEQLKEIIAAKIRFRTKKGPVKSKINNGEGLP